MNAIQTSTEKDLQRHKEAIYAMLQTNGKSLIDLIKKCPEYADDYRAVMTATETYKDAIYLASEKLFSNKEFAFNACWIQSVAFQKLPENLRNDFDFVKSLLDKSIAVYQDLSDVLQGSPAIAKLAIEKKVVTNHIMFTPLKDSVEIMRLIAKNRYGYLKELSEYSDIRNNKAIGSIALSISPDAYKILGERLKYDAEFLANEIRKNPELIDYIPIQDSKFKDTIPMVVAYIDTKDTFQAEYLRLMLDQTNSNLLIAIAKTLKNKPQNHFSEALDREDSRLTLLENRGTIPATLVKDFCLEQLLVNLDKENLMRTVKSIFLKQFMQEEIDRRELLAIGLAPKSNRLKSRKIKLS